MFVRSTQRRKVVKDFDLGLKLAREAKGWTQVRLAKEATVAARRLTGDPEAKVSYAMVAMIETGVRNPSLEMATYLALALGRDPRELGRVLDDRLAQERAS